MFLLFRYYSDCWVFHLCLLLFLLLLLHLLAIVLQWFSGHYRIFSAYLLFSILFYCAILFFSWQIGSTASALISLPICVNPEYNAAYFYVYFPLRGLPSCILTSVCLPGRGRGVLMRPPPMERCVRHTYRINGRWFTYTSKSFQCARGAAHCCPPVILN